MMSLSWCRVRPLRTHSSCRLALRGDRARIHLRDFCDIKYESCTHKKGNLHTGSFVGAKLWVWKSSHGFCMLSFFSSCRNGLLLLSDRVSLQVFLKGTGTTSSIGWRYTVAEHALSAGPRGNKHESCASQEQFCLDMLLRPKFSGSSSKQGLKGTPMI